MTLADFLFSPDLLERYSANGPRYTSTLHVVSNRRPEFTESFDPAHYLQAANEGAPDADLSLYFPRSVLRHCLLLLRM